MKYKIAIVGGGFFGCLASLKLSEIKNVYVDLYEKKENILLSASGKNQMRAHFGYHYQDQKIQLKKFKNLQKNLNYFFQKISLRKQRTFTQ